MVNATHPVSMVVCAWTSNELLIMKIKSTLSLLSLLAFAATADATNLITFDDVADGTVLFTHYPGLTITNPIAAGKNVYGRYSIDAPSPTNVTSVMATGLPFFDETYGIVQIRLDTPAKTVRADLRAVGPGEILGSLVSRPYMIVFNTSGSPIATLHYPTSLLPTTGGFTPGPTTNLSYTSSSANIRWVQLSSEPPSGGNSTYVLVDNFSYDVGPPANDQCAGAIALTDSTPYSMNTGSATSTGDPIPICGSGVSNGVWFTFTPSMSGVVSIYTCGSDYDTVVQVYTGTCASPAQVAGGCNDDSGLCSSGNRQSYVRFIGSAGTTYRILVDGYDGASGNLTVTASVVPARTLTVNSWPTSGASLTGFSPADVDSVSGGTTSFSLTYANGTAVQLAAPATFGSLQFLNWQVDGVDQTVGNRFPTVTMSANHTVTAVYSVANDLCSGAVPLSAGVPYSMSTSNATSTGDPIPGCQSSFSSGVWFTFTAPSSGVVTISTCPSDFDTVVAAYTGTCGALAPVPNGCNDDAGFVCPFRQSFVAFPATPGTTYYILAGGYFGHTGNLNITANLVPPRTLNVASSPVSGLATAVYPADINGYAGGNTAFSRTYADGVRVAVTAATSDGFNVFQKWQLDGVDLTVAATAYVVMNNTHSLTAVYASPNDLCAGAITLTNGVAFGENTATATDAGDPQVPCASLHCGVWFTFTPAITEQVTISTCGSAIDTVAQVFTGSCGALQRVAYGCDDDNGPACTGNNASLVFYGLAGTNYYILVGSFGAAGGNISVTATSGLFNDSCVNALRLAYGVPLTMTTANTTTATNEIPSCQPVFGKSVWFKFTSPITGPVPISTCGSSFDTVLQVYTNACGALTPVICADDDGPYCAGTNASLTLNALAATDYYIMAGGWNNHSGTLKIVAGTRPVITPVDGPSYVLFYWPSYYYPAYVLQRSTNTTGVGLANTWVDQFPNNYAWAYGKTNPPAFFRLVTP